MKFREKGKKNVFRNIKPVRQFLKLFPGNFNIYTESSLLELQLFGCEVLQLFLLLYIVITIFLLPSLYFYLQTSKRLLLVLGGFKEYE